MDVEEATVDRDEFLTNPRYEEIKGLQKVDVLTQHLARKVKVHDDDGDGQDGKILNLF